MENEANNPKAATEIQEETIEFPKDEMIRREMANVFAGYRGQKGVLVPLLQETQDRFGYLPEVAINEISRFTGVARSEIYGVVTFYTKFRLTPSARNTITVCEGTACHVKGGWRLRDAVERELGIEVGEVTADLQFGLERVACIGCCALAPTLVLNEKVYAAMTPAKVTQLLDGVRKGKV